MPRRAPFHTAMASRWRREAAALAMLPTQMTGRVLRLAVIDIGWQLSCGMADLIVQIRAVGN